MTENPARPRLTEAAAAKLENLEELLRDDHNVAAVVTRAGYPSVAAATIAARRGGRNDLAAMLRFYGPPTRSRDSVNVYGDGAADFYIRFDGDPWAGITAAATLRRGRPARGAGADTFERNEG